MRPFTTDKYKVGTEAWQRFYAGFLFRRNLPWVGVALVVLACLAAIDIRLMFAGVIVLVGAFPMAWIVVLSKFMKIAENRRNLLSMAVSLTPHGDFVIKRWIPDSEGEESDDRVAIETYGRDSGLRFNLSGGYLQVRGNKLHMIVPLSAIRWSPCD